MESRRRNRAKSLPVTVRRGTRTHSSQAALEVRDEEEEQVSPVPWEYMKQLEMENEALYRNLMEKEAQLFLLKHETDRQPRQSGGSDALQDNHQGPPSDKNACPCACEKRFQECKAMFDYLDYRLSYALENVRQSVDNLGHKFEAGQRFSPREVGHHRSQSAGPPCPSREELKAYGEPWLHGKRLRRNSVLVQSAEEDVVYNLSGSETSSTSRPSPRDLDRSSPSENCNKELPNTSNTHVQIPLNDACPTEQYWGISSITETSSTRLENSYGLTSENSQSNSPKAGSNHVSEVSTSLYSAMHTHETKRYVQNWNQSAVSEALSTHAQSLRQAMSDSISTDTLNVSADAAVVSGSNHGTEQGHNKSTNYLSNRSPVEGAESAKLVNESQSTDHTAVETSNASSDLSGPAVLSIKVEHTGTVPPLGMVVSDRNEHKQEPKKSPQRSLFKNRSVSSKSSHKNRPEGRSPLSNSPSSVERSPPTSPAPARAMSRGESIHHVKDRVESTRNRVNLPGVPKGKSLLPKRLERLAYGVMDYNTTTSAKPESKPSLAPSKSSESVESVPSRAASVPNLTRQYSRNRGTSAMNKTKSFSPDANNCLDRRRLISPNSRAMSSQRLVHNTEAANNKTSNQDEESEYSQSASTYEGSVDTVTEADEGSDTLEE